ncbi:MAG: murein biosynthesis integral membrane protein MurJ [Rhodospirillales bacterium]|nr:murein biosynthesis integral membrane protein MurJ [Rhodospirillales bacterium]
MVLIRSIATIGTMTLISRVLGFVRDVLIAALLGAGAGADAFFVAFKFPNLFRRLFAEGAFNLAFVPLYAGDLETEGPDSARAFAEQALSVLLWSLLVFVAAFEILMPWAMYVFAPGFAADPDKFSLAVILTRITFPYLLFISMVSLLAGVLNSHGRFAAAAATPILLNLFLIGAVLVLVPLMPSPGHALAWGVAGAGVAQFAWLYVHCVKAGVRLRLVRPRLTAKVKTLLKRMAPVAVGAGIYQLNLLIDTVIASLLPSGAISYLFFADRVTQLPLGVVGVAAGTALLPLLSRQLQAGEGSAALTSQNRALEFVFLLTLPAAVALFVIAGPIVTVLFERGAFDAMAAQATASALAVYALGLPAYVLVKALAPGYFARGDTATPIKVGALAMVVNLGLNLVLMGPFLHVGIAMATAVSSWLNAGLLALILFRRGHLRLDGQLKRRLPRMILASVLMGLGLYTAVGGLDGMLAGGEGARIAALVLLVGVGGVTYMVLAQLTGAARLKSLKALMRGDTAA